MVDRLAGMYGFVHNTLIFKTSFTYYVGKYIVHQLCNLFAHRLQLHHSKGTLHLSVEVCNTSTLQYISNISSNLFPLNFYNYANVTVVTIINIM
jgi:hypothetical protein